MRPCANKGTRMTLTAEAPPVPPASCGLITARLYFSLRDLASRAQLIGDIRKQVREVAHMFGNLDRLRIADVEVGLTELLVNVAEHVPDERALVTVEFLDAGGVVVQVWDSSAQPPVIGELGEGDDWLNLDEGGRGLALIRATASSLSWRQVADGKIVEAAYLT
ncbi:ATP-binding protein [Kitasatospora acidiphila]|nr:ATP-binding protein [Kitasatospora acidiphila]